MFLFALLGACCVRPNPKDPNKKHQEKRSLPVASWREIMNTFTLEFPSICARGYYFKL